MTGKDDLSNMRWEQASPAELAARDAAANKRKTPKVGTKGKRAPRRARTAKKSDEGGGESSDPDPEPAGAGSQLLDNILSSGRDVVATATGYTERRWVVLRLPSTAKKPKTADWQHLGVTDPNEIPKHFRADDNIGVVLGERSGGLVDFDLDCPEAIKLAPHFLPETGAVFGRASKRASHWLYYSDLWETENKAVEAFDDPRRDACKDAGISRRLLEVRTGGGGQGAQTVFPGSRHSGEDVRWEPGKDGEPARVDGVELKRCAAVLAAAVQMARAWPSNGSGLRHDAAMALSGFLYRCAKWSAAETSHFVGVVAECAGDEEWRNDRARTAVKRAIDNAPGVPKLAEAFGERVASKLQEWLCANDGEAQDVLEHPWLKEQLGTKAVVLMGDKARIARWKPFRLYDDCTHDVFAPLDKKDFLIHSENRFVIRTSKTGREHKVMLAQMFMEQARRYDDVVFEPMRRTPDNVLNLWPPEKGFGVEARPGSCELFKKHLLEIAANGNQEHFECIWNWCAWSVQNPDKPAEVALVFKGGRRAGKGVVGRTLCRLFGAFGWHAAGANSLTGDYNGHLIQIAMLFADEAFYAGDKAGEQLLKRMLTEDTLEIHPKFLGKFLIRNSLHVIMASNNDWVIPAGHDEGRFAVFEINDKWAGPMTPEKKAYFDPLYAELENGGREALLHELLETKLGNWHPRDSIPQTEALLEQKALSMPHVDQLAVHLAQEGALPDTDPRFPDVTPTGGQDANAGLHGLSKQLFGQRCPAFNTLSKALRKDWGFTNGKRAEKRGSTRVYIQGLRAPPLLELREMVLKKYPGTVFDFPDQIKWGELDEEVEARKAKGAKGCANVVPIDGRQRRPRANKKGRGGPAPEEQEDREEF